MKKKSALIVIISAMSFLNIFAQSLPNTTWTVYNTSGTLFAYFHFGTDTVFRSFNNVTYTPTSIYTENGNSFTIVDVPPTSCSTYIGTYTFTIQNDTLNFTLISDQCATGRSAVIADYYWVNLPTGISLLNTPANITIFPNPITNGIVHLDIEEKLKRDCLISIFSFSGAKIF